MIKAVIFDCFGVLTDDNWHAFTSLLPEEIKLKARALNHEYDEGKITRSQFIDQVASVTGRPKSEIEKTLITGENKNIELLKYIAKLRERGYKIGLLSNIASDWIRSEFLTMEEQKLFDVMTFSFEEGLTKPHPNMYEKVLDRLGIEPQQAVFIDDIDRYCHAAEQLGMKSIVYQDLKQTEQDLEKLLK